MRVCLRCDASAAIGGGHVMRCLSLAAALSARGHAIVFACSPESRAAVGALDASGSAILELSGAALADPEALDAAGAHAFVVDHYGLGADYEAALRARGPILVFEDRPGRPHRCDILLDTAHGRTASDYRGLVPAGARVLAGPAYAPLRPGFAALRPAALDRRDARRSGRLLLCFGAGDHGALTEPVARLLLDRLPKGAALDVALGRQAPSLGALRRLSAGEARLALHVDPPAMAELMAAADIGIGASGQMSWERCCLGLPSVAVPLVDNQRDIAAALGAAGAAEIVAAAPGEGVLAERVARAALDLLSDAPRLEALSAAAAALCDGEGAARAARALEVAARPMPARAAQSFGLRRAGAEDSLRVWAWRNDPAARAASLDARPIPWRAHRSWFAGALSDPSRLILVGTDGEGEPFGMARFDESGGRLRASVNLAPFARGMGQGAPLLDAACRGARARWPRAPIRAEIRTDNPVSRRVFERCGFVPVEGHGEAGVAVLELAPPGA